MPPGHPFLFVFYAELFMGRRWWAGPARPIKFSPHGPRPGPARQVFIWWDAARPGSLKFHLMGRGPAQPIKLSADWPWPGQAHHIFKIHGPARPGPSMFQISRPGPVRPMTWRRGPSKIGFIWAGPIFWWAGSWAGPRVVQYQNVRGDFLKDTR